MTDTPGRLLSSLSSADGKPPKVGGCVGVFFQLFDWNRRLSGKHIFSTKSLPAERPPSNKFNDEKLPMAKLLLIADENRGLFPRNSSSETQSEVGSERSSSDNGSSKKPGVVARLMGLESLPEPELPAHHQSRELKQRSSSSPSPQKSTMYRYQDLQMLEDLLQGQHQQQQEDFRKLTTSSSRKEAPPPACKEPTSKPLREEKMPKNTKKPQDPMDKVPLSPKKSPGGAATPFSSILSSPSKSNSSKSKMIAPPIKSQSRKASILMGAAARILDQPSRTRALLLDRPASEARVNPPAGAFHGELKRSLARGGKQVKAPEVKKEKPSKTLLQGKLGGKTTGGLKVGKQQVKPSPRAAAAHDDDDHEVDVVVENDQGSVSEHDDESLSVECDSQGSSSKENRNNSVRAPPPKIVPKLSRSGSVKEEQPPTPPSRGSLFRSKSVREEAATTPSPLPLQPSASPQQQVLVPEKNSSALKGAKEVRLKREKRPSHRPPESFSSPEPVQKPEASKRKPALDQGRTSCRVSQQDSQKPKATTPKLQEQQQKKTGGILSYDRIFGARKQGKGSSNGAQKSKPETEEIKTTQTREVEEVESRDPKPQKSENSLMKSILRRNSKSHSKAETVSSSSKKKAAAAAAEKKPRSNHQRRNSGGTSPLREPRESPRLMEQDLFVEKIIDPSSSSPPPPPEDSLENPVFDVSPEKSHGVSAPVRVRFESDKITDRSLEDILKTILSKSLGRSTTPTTSPLGKECKTPAPEENADDPSVIDMDVSPLESEAASRPEEEDHQLDELPCKVLQFDEESATTPLALPLDTGDGVKEACIAGDQDGGQPSPVSVLDFSALQSPFPSEMTTSCEEIDEDGKQVLESDAESFLAGNNNNPAEESPAESCRLDFPSEPETLDDAAISYEGQEIDLYVRDVLMSAGFTGDDHQDSAAGAPVPCTEQIFHRLEKQRSLQGEIEFPISTAVDDADESRRKFEAPGSCHRLMYECIGEALNLVLDPFRDERHHQAMASSGGSLRQRPVGEELVAEVSGYILAWREMTLGMVDDLVEVDMSSAAGKWKEFREESLEIGTDLERMIFRSVMEDLIFDLVGLRFRRRAAAGIETLELLH